MNDLDKLSYFLDIEFVKVMKDIMMHHQKYIREFLYRFEMIDFNIIINPFETNANLDEYRDEERV